MTEKRQEAQQSSTRPEEGELEFEMGWSEFTAANEPLGSRRLELPAVNPVKRQNGLIVTGLSCVKDCLASKRSRQCLAPHES
jgi:hypothetical protein